MTISVTAALVVLVLGLIAIIIAIVRENPLSSTFFFNCAFWVTCLALLGGVYLR